MMNDEFLQDLQSTWQGQEHETAAVLQRLRRRRWTPYIALAGEALGCVVALFFSFWFIRTAVSLPQHRLLFTLSAAVMLVIPVFLAVNVALRRSGFAWHDETPQSLLRTGIRRVEASLRALALARWHITVIAVFVMVLWSCEALGLIHAAGFMLLYTAICLVTCVACWLWVMRRRVQLREERDGYARLLAVMEVDE